LRDLLLPPLFTIAFLPFMYLIALFLKYENVFTRIDIVNTNSELARYTKRRILAACRFNLRKLSKLSWRSRILRVTCKNDVAALLQECEDK
jgi:hypothetical protein